MESMTNVFSAQSSFISTVVCVGWKERKRDRQKGRKNEKNK
jgi:hypothetical protein